MEKKEDSIDKKDFGKIKKNVSKSSVKKNSSKKMEITKEMIEKMPTLKLQTEHDIAMDFAGKVYKRFDQSVKAIVLFGSMAKKTQTAGSDIDIIIIIDDASIRWDPELIVWYREELESLLKKNPYQWNLHINTIKLTTWWQDLLRGDPIVINVLRNGEALIDMAGFFNPLKFLLLAGKIKPTPEAIYTNLQRAPMHLARSKAAELNAIEGVYWCMVDSAHAALISANVSPPSPEHIPEHLVTTFVKKGKLKSEYVRWYKDALNLHKDIAHGKIKDLRGVEIDLWQDKAEKFLFEMTQLIKEIVK